MSFVGYVRVSTEEQAKQGLSLDSQEDRIQSYASALDYRIAGIERDVASGRLGLEKRPGLKRAHDLIRGGEVGGLIVYKLDRLSRTTRFILELAEDAQKQGWQLISVSEQLDFTTATGSMCMAVMAALAQMERQLISERTIAGMSELKKRRRACSRFVPWGYRIDGKPSQLVVERGEEGLLVPHAGEQRLLKSIMRLYNRGDGAVRIARRLNARGLGNSRTGADWNPSTMASLIRTATTTPERG